MGRDGIPANPRAWPVSTGRFKAIDRLRRRARFDAMLGELAARLDDRAAPDPTWQDGQILQDDRSRLISTLETVLHVVYLVFTEGYAPASGASVVRADLTDEAIRLGRLLVELLPEPEALGLVALMLLQDARRAARTSPDGELILLPDQDRSCWNRARIVEGAALLERASSSGQIGAYALQAAIAAAHAEAPTAQATDWDRIVGLYDLLARAAYQRALELTRQEPERRFIKRRLNELARGPGDDDASRATQR
jgi:predicted RNA polymerase sigma factor